MYITEDPQSFCNYHFLQVSDIELKVVAVENVETGMAFKWVSMVVAFRREKAPDKHGLRVLSLDESANDNLQATPRYVILVFSLTCWFINTHTASDDKILTICQ